MDFEVYTVTGNEGDVSIGGLVWTADFGDITILRFDFHFGRVGATSFVRNAEFC
jgi:hypothetical protein